MPRLDPGTAENRDIRQGEAKRFRSLDPTGRALLALAIGSGILLRLVNFFTAKAIEMDGVVYARMGEAISRGDIAEALKGVFPPVYPALVGLFHLVIPDLETAGRSVSLVLGSLFIYVSFLIFRSLLDEKKALVGAFFVAIHPYLVLYSGQVISEATAVFLFTVMLATFYKGWTGGDAKLTAISGALLALMYMTRPEYLVYVVPLALLLLTKRRYSNAALFVLCFMALAFPYLYYMRVETGMWILSKKAMLMDTAPKAPQSVYLVPAPSIVAFFRNIPEVAYHFFEATFIPFLLLLVAGFRRTARPFRLLAFSLFGFHVLSIALLTPSIRRFSVPFIPFMLVFAVEGFEVVKEFVGRSVFRRKTFYALCSVAVVLCVTQGITFGHRSRGLDKKAGQFLLSRDPGTGILSRLPFAAFYSKGAWVNPGGTLSGIATCSDLARFADTHGIRYLVVDDKMMQQHPVISKCTPALNCLAEFRDDGDSVRIYGFSHE